MKCADCGATIERQRNGHWATRITKGWKGWSFCCRTVTKWDDEKDCAILISADYHFAPGETQRHQIMRTTPRPKGE